MGRCLDLILWLWILSAPGNPLSAAEVHQPFLRLIHSELKERIAVANFGEGLCALGTPISMPSLLSTFYQGRDFAPVWIEGTKVSRRARTLMSVLENASSEGLRPEDYHVAELETLMQSLAGRFRRRNRAWISQSAELDLLLSDAFFSYNLHCAMGRAPGEARGKGIDDNRRAVRIENRLINQLSRGEVVDFGQMRSRTDPLYAGLKNALRRYRDLAARAEWHEIPAGLGFQPDGLDSVQVTS